MSKFECVCFDLDGTLCDSKPGILNGLNYMFETLNVPTPPQDYLLKFIGLSLDKSLSKFTDFDERKIEHAISVFRTYYSKKGLYEGELYTDAEELIKNLSKSGIDLFLVTAKPQNFAEAILEHFNLIKYFKGIYGLDPNKEYPGKSHHLSQIIKENTYKNLVMIGDRHMDIDAANTISVSSIAVTYGYGSEEELKNATPSYFAANCKEVEKIII